MPYQPDETEQDVLDVLKREGRANPYRIREETDHRKQYINDALRQLEKAELVRKVTTGLYEYAGEETDDEADLRGRLQDALEARDDAKAEVDRLKDELADCKELLDDARGGSAVDIAALRRHIEAAQAAAERGDRGELESRLEQAEGLLDG